MNDAGWLLITTAVSLVAGAIAGWGSAVLRQREARKERLREEVLRWANPIVNAVLGLKSRLRNILEDQLRLALSPGSAAVNRPVDEDWAVSYDYVMPSTLFLFAEYFAWVQLLRERVSLELFESEQSQERFLRATWKVTGALGAWPLKDNSNPEKAETGEADAPLTGVDTQVFALQQRAIGELVIDRDHDPPRLLTYRQFLDELEQDARVAGLFEPLRVLVEDLEPGTKRWRRLESTVAALETLESECRAVLRVRGGR
jgi:hypothetical protein